jgi:N-acetylglutamate synthase-like GNAT family acetyltransferase
MTTQFKEILPDGSTIYIRPIRKDDIERERYFVDGLSKQTRYFRFLGGVSHLSEKQLAQFCDVDQIHDMAYVALVANSSADLQIGVARYVADPDTKEAEFAITVSDDWQDRGVDEALLTRLVEYAQSMGIEALYSVDLVANTLMRALAKRCGFESKTDPHDARQLIHRLRIESVAPQAQIN